jgi:hypothetical protein
MRKGLAGVRGKIQVLAQVARKRFPKELSGRVGKKLFLDLDRIEDALVRIHDGGSGHSNRTINALAKAEKRITGVEDATFKKLRKRVKRARKTLLKVLR